MPADYGSLNPVIETPVATPGAPPTPAPAAPAAATPPVTATPAAAKEPTLAEHEHANRPERRHRARSQEAGPEDVPRIRNLTARNHALQAELDALKGAAATPPPAAAVAAPPPTAAKPATVAPPPTRVADIAGPGVIPVVAADKDPEPNPADYADDPSKNYVKDQARWEARQEIREANARASADHLEKTNAAEKTRLARDWERREVIAKGKYADFEQVAYAPTRIPAGSMIDNYIIEAESGLDVLYYLQKNHAELDAMLALKLFDPATGTYPQLESLSSLARRLTPGRSSDATTGSSAAAPPVVRLPRPPNPVRTGPVNVATDEPPGDDASIAQHEAHWGQKRR